MFVLVACGTGGSSSSPEAPLDESQLVVYIENDNVKIFAKGSDSHSNHYIEYNIKHIDNSSINADLWRLYELYENKNLKNTKPYIFEREYGGKSIANAGEWEAAIREVGAGDFIGGFHGDERMTSVSLLIDDNEQPLLNSEFVAKDVKFNQSSVLYSWYTGKPIALHEKNYTFSQQGIELAQKIEWLEAVKINRAYLTMFPIKRKINGSHGEQITDLAWYLPSGEMLDVSESGFEKLISYNTSAINIEGSESRFNALIEVVKHPNLPNYQAFVQNTEQYNKIYFDMSGAYETTIGEVWETLSNYKITTYN